jgi:hypothetical protein
VLRNRCQLARHRLDVERAPVRVRRDADRTLEVLAQRGPAAEARLRRDQLDAQLPSARPPAPPRRAGPAPAGRPPDGDQLVYLALDTGWAAVAPRQRLGVQTITIESVVGTFDDHKAVAFDRCFRPPRWSRAAGR